MNTVSMTRMPWGMLIVLIVLLGGSVLLGGANAWAEDRNSADEGVSAGQNAADEAPETEQRRAARTKRYSFRRNHDPNGIGKFYMGREIAKVMSHYGAPWLERPTREQEEHLSKLVKALKLEPGMVVADIGAGTGVISILMAREVAPEGKVLAVDIQDEMLALLEKKLEREGIENVVPVKGRTKSANLKEASVDLALMVDVYHEFEFPYEMMLDISRAIKPGGRVVLVEYRKEDPRVPIKLVHKMSEAQVKKEIEQDEFRLKWQETIDVLPRQHIAVFERIAPEADRDE